MSTADRIPLRPDYGANRQRDGRSIQRAIAASTLGKLRGVDEERLLRQSWPRDENALLMLKAAVSPTSTASAGVLSVDQIAVFASLAPGSAALKLFDASVKLDLAGLSTIRIPRVGALAKKPIFVGEGLPAPAIQLSTAATTLGPAKKVLVLSGLTGELENATPETASAVIGNVLADATAAAIDLVAFDATAGDAVRPAGLLNGVTPTPAVAAAGQATLGELIATDLSNLAAAIGTAGIDASNVVFVAGPREAVLIQALVKNDVDVLMTLGLPAKSVAAFAPSAVYSGYQGAPTIETSKEAAIHFEDTSPLPIVASPNTVAAPVRSAFQTDVLIIRVRAWAAWAVAPGGAQIVNLVNW